MPVVSPGTKKSLKTNFKGIAIDNDFQLFASARKGLSPMIFYQFAQLIAMPDKLLAGLLHLSPRTVSNYKENRKLLEPVQSEHLLKLIALYDKGEELFGSVQEFNYWLNKPTLEPAEKLADWLITPGGVDLVTLELDRMAYGYPA